MATKYKVGDVVYVPSVKLSDPASEAFALVERTVRGRSDGSKSVIVDDRDSETIAVSTKFVQPQNLGFAVIQIGDLQSEQTLLDPLNKSVLQYLRLLVEDGCIRGVRVRTLQELTMWWGRNSAAVNHCMLVGHGSNGVAFLDHPGVVTGQQLGTELEKAGPAKPDRKTFISLACKTGRKDFGQELSRTKVCNKFIGPMQSVHGASASQYFQTLLAHHLLEGRGLLTAHRIARRAATTSTAFRLYVDGDLQTDNR